MRTMKPWLVTWAAALAIAAPSLAQTAIASIAFDLIPPDTTLVSPHVSLNGDTAIQGDLGLAGDLTLSAGAVIRFDPPRQGSVMLGPGDFVSFDNPSHWRVSESIYSTLPGGDGLYGTAALHLPTGASVSGMRCWFYDNDATADFASFAGARLNGRAEGNLDSFPYWIVSGLNVSHQENALIEAVGTENFPLVVDSTSTYTVVFNTSSTAGQSFSAAFRFYGCRIDYLLSTWAP